MHVAGHQPPPGRAEPVAAAEPALRTAASGGPAFLATPQRCQASDKLVTLTTTAVLNVPRQHRETVVAPLGAILSPSPSHSLPSYALDPATCTACGAYINVYAPASGHRGEWHCNFCLHLNSPVEAGPQPAGPATPPLEAPPPHHHHHQQQQQQQPTTSSFVTPPTMPSLGPAAGGSGSLPSTPLTPSQVPLSQEAVDYISPATLAPPPSSAGTSLAASPAGAGSGLPAAWVLPGGAGGFAEAGGAVAVLVVDLVATPAALAVVRAALLEAARGLPGSTLVGLVTCGASIQAYRLGGWARAAHQGEGDGEPEAAAACDVLPGDVRSYEAALLAALRPGVHVARVERCRQILLAALRSLRPFTAGGPPRPRCIPGAVEVALHLCELPFSSAAGGASLAAAEQGGRQPQQQQGELGEPEEQPALGSPLRLGRPAAQQMERDEGYRPPGHIVIVTTGRALQGYSPLPPEAQAASAAGAGEEEGEGEGEQPQPSTPDQARVARGMNHLANSAALQGVTIDVLAAEVDADHIPVISPLAQGTAGLFVQHAHCDESFASNVTSAVRRPAGLTASLEVRTSSGLTVGDTYGAVVPLFAAGRPTEQWHALTGGTVPPPPRWLHRRTWHYRCGPPSHSAGVTLMLHCDRPLAQTYAYIQVVWSWMDEGGHRVQRIVTRRLSTTHNPTAVAEALDPGVAALVWAKTVVAQALEKGAAFDRKETEILRRSLGKALIEFVSRFGFPDESSRGWFSGPTRFTLPSAFLPIARALYCLYRGPMLHHALGGHPEERALLQAHFMTASLQLSSLICMPSLYLLTHIPSGTDLTAAAANESSSPPNGSVGRPKPQQPLAAEGDFEGVAGSPDAACSRSSLPPSPSPIRTLGSKGSGAVLRERGLSSCFAAVPAVDLALHDAPAAVLDHGSHMFVWLSSELPPAESAAAEALCRRFALRLGCDRVPVPEVVVDGPGLLARLVPVRRDPHRLQLAQAPMLGAVSWRLLERASSALGEGEEPSLVQWLREAGIEPELEGELQQLGSGRASLRGSGGYPTR